MKLCENLSIRFVHQKKNIIRAAKPERRQLGPLSTSIGVTAHLIFLWRFGSINFSGELSTKKISETGITDATKR